jgi:hypothetical protein
MLAAAKEGASPGFPDDLGELAGDAVAGMREP